MKKLSILVVALVVAISVVYGAKSLVAVDFQRSDAAGGRWSPAPRSGVPRMDRIFCDSGVKYGSIKWDYRGDWIGISQDVGFAKDSIYWKNVLDESRETLTVGFTLWVGGKDTGSPLVLQPNTLYYVGELANYRSNNSKFDSGRECGQISIPTIPPRPSSTPRVMPTPRPSSTPRPTPSATPRMTPTPTPPISGEKFVVGIEGSSGQMFVVSITDATTIQQAHDCYSYSKQHPEDRRCGLLVTGMIKNGDGGFNTGWSWHLIPNSVRMVESAIELCDGLPSHVERAGGANFDSGRYCPWNSYIKALGGQYP